MDKRKLLTIGILGALAVALGAMGAHFLKSKVQAGIMTSDQLDGFEKGVKYHMYHTIGMLLLIILNKLEDNKYFMWAYAFFFWGIVMFSGSLYFLTTRNLMGMDWLKFLGPVTPIGGICFIIGWICLGLSLLKSDKNK
ncbi:MAG: DUF423 domain-containing protein [Bacteroidia bacterium]|nr:DUF423 domain-containing protein [Bacteroidia bacterium]